MKIDTHQHYWRYQAQEFGWISDAMPVLQQDRMPADCETQMHFAGVDKVVAVQARNLAQETDFLLQLAAEHPQIAGVVGWADLSAPNLADTLDRWAHNPALRGIRHGLQDEPDVAVLVRSTAFQAGVAALQARKLAYDVLVYAHQMPQVLELCARQDAHWLVLDHLGKPSLKNWVRGSQDDAPWSAAMRSLASMPHVMCKLSGVVTETDWSGQARLGPQDLAAIYACYDRALEVFGPARLMFGSDWPVCQLAAPYEVVWVLANDWAQSRLSATEQQDFWSGNAIRCYGLTP